MKPIIKSLLNRINGIELWMSAFPLVRCLIEGHELVTFLPENGAERLPVVLAAKETSVQVHLCKRCKLVYWK